MKLEQNEVLILQWGKKKEGIVIDVVEVIKSHTNLSKAQVKRLISDGSVKFYTRFK